MWAEANTEVRAANPMTQARLARIVPVKVVAGWNDRCPRLDGRA